MKILHIGATGYVGTAVAEKLKEAGHEVVGLARSEESAAKIEDRGYRAYKGDLQDPESVTRGAREAEAVVYTTALDKEAVGTIAGALEGSGKPFVSVVGATIYGDTGEQEAVEDQVLSPPSALEPMAEAEKALLDAAGRDVRSASVRAALVYGRSGGAIPKVLLDDARKSGMARYVGTGGNQWAAVHVDDLARTFVLAVEKAPPVRPLTPQRRTSRCIAWPKRWDGRSARGVTRIASRPKKPARRGVSSAGC